MTGAAVRLLDDDGPPLHHIVARWHQLHDELCVSPAKAGKLLQQHFLSHSHMRAQVSLSQKGLDQTKTFARSKFNADGCPMDQEDWNGDNGMFRLRRHLSPARQSVTIPQTR